MPSASTVKIVSQPQYNFIEIASRTNDWLQSVRSQIKETEVNLSLQFLLCIVLCGHLQQLSQRERCKKAEEALDGLDGFDVDDLLQTDCGLVLLSANIQQALMGKLLPNFRGYVEKINAVLSTIDERADLEKLHHARWLLYRLGYASMPLRTDCCWPEDLPSFLISTSEQLCAFTRQVAIQTDYGTRRVEPPEGLCKVLRVSAIYMLQQYNFDLGGTLLRTLASLGDRDSFALKTARTFICENQHPSGSFGLLGMELNYLSVQYPDYNPLKFLLPYTIACLWTLVETDAEPYSLYGSELLN